MESLYNTFFEEFAIGEIPVEYKKIPGVCSVCGKLFNSKKAVYVHMRIHTGEKPYICEICDRSFNQNSNLKRHLRAHRGEKPFYCGICNKSLSCKSKPFFLEHVRSHSGEKPYACQLCDKSYSFKASLINHIKSHAKKHSFVCDTCHAGFSCKGELNSHMHIHSADKEVYMCNLCKRVFSSNFSLSAHLMKSHDILTAYECKICHKRYYNYEDLQNHQKLHEEKENVLVTSEQKKIKPCSILGQGKSTLTNIFITQNKNSASVTENKVNNIADVLAANSNIEKVTVSEYLKLLRDHGTVNNSFPCRVCQNKFSTVTEVNEHVKTHIKSKNITVIQNEDIFNVTESNPKDYVLTSATEVITPQQLEHLLGSDNVNHRFFCAVCQKEFGCMTEINEHVKTHVESKKVY